MLRRLGLQVWRRLPSWMRGALTWCLKAHFVVGTVAIIDDADSRVLLARHTYRRSVPWALPCGWVARSTPPRLLAHDSIYPSCTVNKTVLNLLVMFILARGSWQPRNGTGHGRSVTIAVKVRPHKKEGYKCGRAYRSCSCLF